MSRQLLMSLNGDNKGNFYRWLSTFKGEPRIAWYPSAGTDFRDLLYLNSRISELYPASKEEPTPPDIFIHTDYFPFSNSTFLDDPIIYSDQRTKVKVKSIEELPRCVLPLDAKIVDFPKGSDATNRVLFLEIEVNSVSLGKFSAPVIYAFVENSAFCAKKILPNNGKLSHIIHVRYGVGFGGGSSSGVWLINVLKQLGCECFVTDGHHVECSGDVHIYKVYPYFSASNKIVNFEPIRTVPSVQWSSHGDVSWNIVK